MSRRGGRALAVVVAALAVGGAALFAAGCSDESVSYNDQKIIEKLNLKKVEGTYAIDGDVFCGVSKELLNDADEVEDAIDKDKVGLIVASREGNVGVEGVPPFANDCRDAAQKKLNKLDPAPQE